MARDCEAAAKRERKRQTPKGENRPRFRRRRSPLGVCLFLSLFAVPRRFSLQPSCHLAVFPLSSFSLLSLLPLSLRSPLPHSVTTPLPADPLLSPLGVTLPSSRHILAPLEFIELSSRKDDSSVKTFCRGFFRQSIEHKNTFQTVPFCFCCPFCPSESERRTRPVAGRQSAGRAHW